MNTINVYMPFCCAQQSNFVPIKRLASVWSNVDSRVFGHLIDNTLKRLGVDILIFKSVSQLSSVVNELLEGLHSSYISESSA